MVSLHRTDTSNSSGYPPLSGGQPPWPSFLRGYNRKPPGKGGWGIEKYSLFDTRFLKSS